jgi:hypothetical protein
VSVASGVKDAGRRVEFTRQIVANSRTTGVEMNTSDILKIVVAQAVVTVFAVLVTYVKLRQDFRQYARQQLFSLSVDRLRRQLSEFYGPLHMLSVANERIAKVAWGTDMWHRVWRDILIPSELKIEDILLSKSELLDEGVLPASFLAFLTHARVARSYLETGQGIEYFDKGIHYPPEFNTDVAAAYEKVKRRYSDAIQGLESSVR